MKNDKIATLAAIFAIALVPLSLWIVWGENTSLAVKVTITDMIIIVSLLFLHDSSGTHENGNK